MAVFVAAFIVLGKSYFGARISDDQILSELGEEELGLDLSGLSYFVSIVKPE